MLIAASDTAGAQTVTPDLFSPNRQSQIINPDSPLRRTTADALDPLTGTRLPDPDRDRRGSSSTSTSTTQIGQIPTYGLPAANGASTSGYDSLNRKRLKLKYYPGQAKPKPPPGPGSPVPAPPPLNAAGQLRLSIPPSETASKPPVPPAMAGNITGQPPRRRLKIDDDPFGAVGDYAGSFMVKTAVEVMAGYDTNPGRLNQPQGRAFYMVAPEFLAVSDWERHSVVADLRGSFTGYNSPLTPNADGTPLSAPLDVDRPSFNGHIDGRLDVSRDTHLTGEVRLLVATDNPGSPNIQTGLDKYPIYTTVGGTFGFDQNFNRLQVSGGATIDRTDYQWSKLTDGTMSSNDDRNFTQYGGVARVSYELTPAVKPFVEVQGDSRVHDLTLDRNGYARDSAGGYAKAGSSFEFTRLLFGEVSVGYAMRDYADTRLGRLEGLLTTASLTWTATPLTTAKFYSDTQLGETTLPGTSGVLSRTYTVEVDHDFRRWLSAVGKFTYGTLEYKGDSRNDTIYSVSTDIIYKMTRSLWIKGTIRRDWLDSNQPLNNSASTVVMLGVRVQN
ncbi:outer membrane beta-barrel protein [Bradyrhizobium genosp. L]|uniref:outer membrane beta-barrel protein n=1 Tax=Bradyrhizobium genosp. L TaxID=83637 RepID=UPI003D9AD58F